MSRIGEITGIRYTCGCVALRNSDARLPRECPLHGNGARLYRVGPNPNGWVGMEWEEELPLSNPGLKPIEVPAGL